MLTEVLCFILFCCGFLYLNLISVRSIGTFGIKSVNSKRFRYQRNRMDKMADDGRAIQVVSVEDGYCLDEEALSSVLLGEAADRPVVLCSVAGAYRGGKSFLLDYLLRYLRADNSARTDGTWLGGDEEPLRGFSWRAGSERDTTGLLLWSQPFVTNLPSGDEVAVILMDTQGAFDWRSSVRDCSTVFASSALLASVQLYNVSRDVRSDEIQHLQLFTEYGRLAAEGEGGKAFETLQLVVRDWGCPYDHAYGANGGHQLLQTRYQEMEGTELTELWQSIRTSYQQVRCFLMPHPGLRALDRDFDGRVADLTPEFKNSLLELAPSILAPENLAPKTVNGMALTGRALFHYFKSYISIFNSDQMPTPTSILNATAEAGLLALCEDTRVAYRRAMEEQQASVAPAALHALHERAMDDALRMFAERRTLASTGSTTVRFEELRKELEDQLNTYESINNAKIQKGMTEAETAYKDHFRIENRELESICMKIEDFEIYHYAARDVAVAKFDSTRVLPYDSEVEELDLDLDLDFLERLEEIQRSLKTLNEANNIKAVRECTNWYKQRMMDVCAPDKPALHPRELLKEDEDSHSTAVRMFREKRSVTSEGDDSYEQKIVNKINELKSKWTKTNEWKNESAVTTATAVYNESMTRSCKTSLIDPLRTFRLSQNFDGTHEDCQRMALETFYDLSRSYRRRLHCDDKFLDSLTTALEERKKWFQSELQKNAAIAGVTTVFSTLGSVAAVASAVGGVTTIGVAAAALLGRLFIRR